MIIHKEYVLLIVAPLRNVAGDSRHNDACESSHSQKDDILPAPSQINGNCPLLSVRNRHLHVHICQVIVFLAQSVLGFLFSNNLESQLLKYPYVSCLPDSVQ